MEQENKTKDTNVSATIGTITGLVKAIPVYQDALQPAAKQVGQSLETIAKTVNIALAPIKLLVWGYSQIEEFLLTRVSEKLKNVPEENITTPPPHVAGPAVEALRFTGHDLNLRDLYANLLATAMDKSTIHKAHPGFVEILKNLSSEEAILLQAFTIQDNYPIIDIKAKDKQEKAGFSMMYSNYSHLHRKVELDHPSLVPTYLDNLIRLGILVIPALTYLTSPNSYEPLESDSEIDRIKNIIENDMHRTVAFNRKYVTLTAFGRQFVENVVVEKSRNIEIIND